MYPQYDTCSDQRSQMPYTHRYPTFFIPPQMSVNPVSHTHSAYEPWSYGGNYGYRIPDSHNYFPPYHCSGYPHPYHPPPPLPYFHDACCPSFSRIHHPVHYAHPPNYSMELPIYDYDKKPHRRCPYHPCSWGGDTMEKEPDAEKTTNSLSSAQSKNLPYPIVWIPTEEMNKAKQMHGGFPEPEPNRRNHDESMNSSNQPCDPIKLEKGEKVENQFPFPIIWVPYKQEETGKKDHTEGKTTPTLMMTGHEEGSPFKESVHNNVDQATTMVGKNDPNRCKIIPVKQLDEMVDNNNTISKEAEKELAKNNPEGGSSTKRQTSPLSKTCKLPPVCLRVEPFPKRKNGSGKSRSLSPPKKGRHEEFVGESCAKMELKEENKLLQVADEHTDPKTKEVGNSEGMDSKEVSQENVTRKKLLTEAEAAVLIQAAYRGYEVRKWEPIKKLKEIGKVRDELDGVKSRFKASSSSLEEKERSLIGEMIMNLLLKLDTIQGLHPVARDMRKWTAKELVKLQEEVDCAVKKGDVNKSLEIESSAETEEMKKHDDEEEVNKSLEMESSAATEVMKKHDDEEEVNKSLELESGSSTEEMKKHDDEEEVNKSLELESGSSTEEMKKHDDEEEVNKSLELESGSSTEEMKKHDDEEEVNKSLELESSSSTEEMKKHDEEEEEEVKVCDGDVEANRKGEDVNNSLEMESSASTEEMKKHDDEEEEEVKVSEGDVEANKKGEDVNNSLEMESSAATEEMKKHDDEEGEKVKVCDGDVEANKKEEDNGGTTAGEDNKTTSSFELKEEKCVDMKMDEMMEKLVEKGKEQLEEIRELSERVKMLEKKLAATTSKKRKGGGRSKTRTRH
ncbi:BAG family molecular chaperone regulator 6 isoform X2 [Impatiens glandulifera]|uniref:BAG family molecular chaperone regulator 6 isoform X2 n=1 Tax=Impatiens glandulifera TaxID=253017 RepID=UPI001FB053EB|nr:BAG family molecular chaperone regulator 6 isoform X2 [Impatiens glandulifera]